MKLANQSLRYTSVFILVIMAIWGVTFYFSILHEIKDSIDEELENYKREIIYKASKNLSILLQNNVEGGFYTLEQVDSVSAAVSRDQYIDKEIYMQDADDEQPELEPVRMLITHFSLDGKYYRLTIFTSMLEEDDLVKAILQQSIALYLLLVIIILVTNSFLQRKLWSPFYQIIEQLKKFRLGTTKQLEFTPTATTEFKELQDSASSLVNHATAAFEQQKVFIGNASHELQTPIAIVRNKLEQVLEKNTFTDEQAASIAEIIEIVERMNRLNRSLLLLTKIENKQFSEATPIDINEIVNTTTDELTAFANHKHITIEVLSTETLRATMDQTMARILITNLIKNAIVHNHSGGLVKIDIRHHELIVANTGTEHPLDDTRIFERFYKSNTNQNNSGMGLSIVASICAVYGYQVSYCFEKGLHRFTVQFSRE